MTTQSFAILLAVSVLKGLLFGLLFVWMFPPANRWLARKLGRDPGPVPPAGAEARYYTGLGTLSGSSFALLDFIGEIGERSAMPNLLRWAVSALYLASVYGTVLITRAGAIGQGSRGDAPDAASSPEA